MSADPRYRAEDLIDYSSALFTAVGMPVDRSTEVSTLLVEADLMGHDTHGLNLAAHYLNQLDQGQMKKDGDPIVLNDRGPCLTWDGEYLCGVWLMAQAIREGVKRAKEFGIAAISIRQSHHIACLAAYLPVATDQGMLIKILTSDPAEVGVAPFGGTEKCFTPNPIAMGYPTQGDPVLIDVSMSITTLGMSARLRGKGETFPGNWLVDASGNATNDPAVLVAEPAGALLPMGGQEYGHKGFGLGLMVEAMTSSLSGHGRADKPENHGASVLLQIFDPDAFGGSDAFRREASHLADTCRKSRVPAGSPAVRLPGDGALKRKRTALADGVPLYPGILPALAPWAERFNVTPPKAI